MSTDEKLMTAERHEQILGYLNTNGSINTAYIQRKFNVSYGTARLDLEMLESEGQLKRTHGGALPVRQIGAGKPPKTTAADISEIKLNYLAIARHAVLMIKPHDVVYITPASVGYLMAMNLNADIPFKAVTNSMAVAEVLRVLDNVSLVFLGGEMTDKGCCYDAFAVDMIRRLRFDMCFLTSAAISPSFGLSIQRSEAIPFWNAVIDSSKKAVGLYPAEKIGFDSTVSICAADRLDMLITDTDANDDDVAAIADMGVEVVRVSPPVNEETVQ